MSSTTYDLKKVLAGAQLPALPQSAIRLMELSQNPDNGPAEFAASIEADPGLTGQVLKFVNSSYFGFSREISSVRQAITLVGVRTIKNFSLWTAVFSLVPNPKCGGFDLKSLWQDSLQRALFARMFGRVLGLKDAEDLFVAALLQDMALPLLAKELRGVYEPWIERKQADDRLSTLERVKFGWSHAEAAGQVARTWKLPESLALLIERHTHLPDQIALGDAPAQLAVSLSSLLPAAVHCQWSERDLFRAAFDKLARGEDLAALLQRVDETYMEFAPLLKLPAPARTLSEMASETAAV